SPDDSTAPSTHSAGFGCAVSSPSPVRSQCTLTRLVAQALLGVTVILSTPGWLQPATRTSVSSARWIVPAGLEYIFALLGRRGRRFVARARRRPARKVAVRFNPPE